MSPRVSFIITSQIYTPALETCISLIMRSNDKIKSLTPLPVKFPSTILRGLKYCSVHTTRYAVISIVIFTIHESVILEPTRKVLEGKTSIEKAKKIQKKNIIIYKK